MRLIFLKLDADKMWQHKQTRRHQREPLEELSFLFNIALAPEMGLALDRGGRVAERLTSSAVRCAREAP